MKVLFWKAYNTAIGVPRHSIVSLPPLITSDQVWAFEVPSTEPNFITQKQITAPLLMRILVMS